MTNNFDWYGKKPDSAVPLTDTFIRACLKTGAITPPIGSERDSVNVVMVSFGLFGMAAVAVWLLTVMVWR